MSDTHFRALWRPKRQAERWRLFLESVSTQVKNGDFSPGIIAFTGDLIESPGFRTSVRAFTRGVSALLELAHVCGFIDKPAPVDSWKGVIPDVWWQLLGRRVFLVPGNHDVFLKGLRMGYQRWPQGWRRVASKKSGGQSLIDDSSFEIGPLAIRLVDTNGGRAFIKRARGVYLSADGGAAAWPFSTHGRFGMALMHGHPLQLPYLIQGISSEAGMMVDNSGLLLRDLASLDVRLVLHGHRHLPNVCGVFVHTPDGETHSIAVVAAGSVTAPAKQWPYFGYNWIRIEPDRRVSVHVMRREAGQRAFFLAENRAIVADAGDFEYDSVQKSVEISEAGDEYGRLVIKGFRVRLDRPDVTAIPFQLEHPPAAALAAVHFSATRHGRTSSKLTWDRNSGVLRITPAHTAADDPLDLDLRYCLHNSSPLSRWEARELQLPNTDADWVYHGTMCATRHIEIAVQLPRPFSALTDTDFSAIPDGLIEWTDSRRIVRRAVRRPRAGVPIRLEWSLPSGEPAAAEESRIRVMRYWQAWVAGEHKKGMRVLDPFCAELAQMLSDQVGIGSVDVGVFLPCTAEVRCFDACGGEPRLLLVGEHTSSTPLESVVLHYGQGVAGRALRTGSIVHYHRLLAEETKRKFERGERNTAPENYYSSLVSDRHYDIVVAIPVTFQEFEKAFEPVPPQQNLLIACVASKDAASPLWQFDEKAVQSLRDLTVRTRDELWDHAYRSATDLISTKGSKGI